jgi:PAS domain-containing protein
MLRPNDRPPISTASGVISPSIRELLGYEPDELIGTRAADITHPDDIAPLAAFDEDSPRRPDGNQDLRIAATAQERLVGLDRSLTTTDAKQKYRRSGWLCRRCSIDRRKAYEPGSNDWRVAMN